MSSCAVLTNGSVRCWGPSGYGQLGNPGNGTGEPVLAPVRVNGISNASAVAGGFWHACALLVDGHVKCWGEGRHGQLGDGSTLTRFTPVAVRGVTNATAIAAQGETTCALLADGTVRCWGYNRLGQLGNGTTTDSAVPKPVLGISDAVSIDVGSFHACAALRSGTVKCWGGAGIYELLGDGHTTGGTTPVTVVGINNATEVAAGEHFSCALRSEGSVSCWGENQWGEIGDGTNRPRTTPQEVSGLDSTTAISAGEWHICALSASQTLRCWGRNEAGQIGDGTTEDRSLPAVIKGDFGAGPGPRGGTPSSRAWPAAGLGYSFANEGMPSYATGANLVLRDILVPTQLALTFSDFNTHSSISGALGNGESQGTLLTEMWRSMGGGTCFGLALSGGRFAAGAEALHTVAGSRDDATWNVGSGLSASALLPKPHAELPVPYNRQFLGLDANASVTQFSTEVLASLKGQRHTYGSEPAHGTAMLRAQLEAIMVDGRDLYDDSGRLSSAPGTGFALVTLQAYDSPYEPGYGHAVLAYSEETLANGTLRIDVWDNNFPGQPQKILIRPDGTWTYVDAPYPTDHSGFRLFGSVYSLNRGANREPGFITALPVYAPKELHLFPSQGTGSIVDIAAGGRISNAADADGFVPDTQTVLSSDIALGDGGQVLSFDTDAGELTLAGPDASASVRGADTYMSLDASPGSVPLHVSEDSYAGSIGVTGGAATLRVARQDRLVSSTGASTLEASRDGWVRATSASSGSTTVTVASYDRGGLASTVLYSGPSAVGETLSFSPAEVAAALAARDRPVPDPQSSPAPFAHAPSATSPEARSAPSGRLHVARARAGHGAVIGTTVTCIGSKGARCSGELTVRASFVTRGGRIVAVRPPSRTRSKRPEGTRVLMRRLITVAANQKLVVRLQLDRKMVRVLTKLRRIAVLLRATQKLGLQTHVAIAQNVTLRAASRR